MQIKGMKGGYEREYIDVNFSVKMQAMPYRKHYKVCLSIPFQHEIDRIN